MGGRQPLAPPTDRRSVPQRPRPSVPPLVEKRPEPFQPLLQRRRLRPEADPHPEADYCEVVGNCEFDFTDSRGRTGPVAVSLPPGYAHSEQREVRYPVIYVLHGYGQTPEDLKATIVLLRNWMNSPADSAATRLPKAILVYVDGRCRVGATGRPECTRGTFYTDSVRADGAKIESWWAELMDEIDERFRTMPPTEIEWTP